MKINTNVFYNYIYCDPRKSGSYKVEGVDLILPAEPFYVGKGCGDRSENHIWNALKYDKANTPLLNKIRSIVDDNYNPIRIKINSNLAEVIANENEKFLIKAIGRICRNTGPLVNLRDGGCEGSYLSRQVMQFDQSGSIVSIYPSITVAIKLFGTDSIRFALKNQTAQSGGYIWVWKQIWDQIVDKEMFIKEKLQIAFNLKKYKHNELKVHQICPHTLKIQNTFRSIREASRSIKSDALYAAIRRKSVCEGFYWSCDDSYMFKKLPILEGIDDNGIIVERFNSQNEARKNGYPNICNGIRHGHYKKLTWRLVEIN